MAAGLEGEPDTERFLQAGYDLGLFEDESAQAGEIRFVHQQMQEYFAAWVLAENWDAGELATPWKSADLPESTETLLARRGDADLSELPSTGWEESALMAANLCERPEAFVRDLIPANLALAGRRAAQPGPAISERLRGELQTLLIAPTQDPQADLRARIAAGKALRELGDPRLRTPPMRAGVKLLLPAFAPIPGGEYSIGGDPEGDPDEHPARTLTLARFELALHPVTNAEYARFLQAGGYREDAYWPGRALAWRNGEIGQEATQQNVRRNRQFVLDDLRPEANGQMVPGSDIPYIHHIGLVTMETMSAITYDSTIEKPDFLIQCALLHDVIEDTSGTYDALRAEFGAQVADGVLALSKDPSLPSKNERMQDSLLRIVKQPIEIWMVKL